MGLTIHYRLGRTDPTADVRPVIEALRERALDLPFASVSDIIERTGDECDYRKVPRDDPFGWLLVQSEHHYKYVLQHSLFKDDTKELTSMVPATRMVAFSIEVGDGCEDMNIGLCQYPEHTLVGEWGDIPSLWGYKGKAVKFPKGWNWASFCKTQYASRADHGGMQNFLRCHLSVIRLLDHAKKLKVLRSVMDEGEFWETRNLDTLLKNLDDYNCYIAAFAAGLNKLFPGIEGQLDKEPNLENLAEIGKLNNPQLDKILAAIA